jgi:3-isopropylmalate/(R)-2-methylmalate dehydratase small subunit
LDFGFRAVIASEIADIFRNNSQNVGLLPIVLTEPQVAELMRADGEEITVDLERCVVFGPNNAEYAFEIDGFARHCLLQGMDRLDFLLSERERIERFESHHGQFAGETHS